MGIFRVGSFPGGNFPRTVEYLQQLDYYYYYIIIILLLLLLLLSLLYGNNLQRFYCQKFSNSNINGVVKV